MAFDRIPVQLIDLGNEADIFTWDNAGEPAALPLALGDFVYRDASGALVAVGNTATLGQVLISDGAGGWAPDDQTGVGAGGGIGIFDGTRVVYAIATPVVDPMTEFEPGVSTEIQLSLEPAGPEAVFILFDGTVQGLNSFTITDNITATVFDTVTFTGPIPAGVLQVEALLFETPTAFDIVFDPLNLPTTIALGNNVQIAIEQLDFYLENLDATQVDFDDTLLLSGATNVQDAIDAMATTPGLLPTPFADLMYLISDERAISVDGGTAVSGNWLPRTLNTDTNFGITGASLAADQITLPDGEYFIEMQSVFNTDAQGPLGMTRTRIHNVTDDATVVRSMSESIDGGAQQQANAVSTGCGRFTVAGGPKLFELQYQVEYTRTTRGLGVASGFDTEVYANVKIWQVG